MIEMNITCHNCNHEFAARLREAFQMVKCPICRNEQLVQALGKQVQPGSDDPRFTVPGNRIVKPL